MVMTPCLQPCLLKSHLKILADRIASNGKFLKLVISDRQYTHFLEDNFSLHLLQMKCPLIQLKIGAAGMLRQMMHSTSFTSSSNSGSFSSVFILKDSIKLCGWINCELRFVVSSCSNYIMYMRDFGFLVLWWLLH